MNVKSKKANKSKKDLVLVIASTISIMGVIVLEN